MPNSVGVMPCRSMSSLETCAVTALNARASTTHSLSATSCFRSSDAEVEAPFWARVEVVADFILVLRYMGGGRKQGGGEGMRGWGDEGIRNGGRSYGRGRVGSSCTGTARISFPIAAGWLEGAGGAGP